MGHGGGEKVLDRLGCVCGGILGASGHGLHAGSCGNGGVRKRVGGGGGVCGTRLGVVQVTIAGGDGCHFVMGGGGSGEGRRERGRRRGRRRGRDRGEGGREVWRKVQREGGGRERDKAERRGRQVKSCKFGKRLKIVHWRVQLHKWALIGRGAQRDLCGVSMVSETASSGSAICATCGAVCASACLCCFCCSNSCCFQLAAIAMSVNSLCATNY